MTHEEAIEEACRVIDKAAVGVPNYITEAAIAAYIEARGAILCEKQHTWFDPERMVDLHAALDAVS